MIIFDTLVKKLDKKFKTENKTCIISLNLFQYRNKIEKKIHVMLVTLLS